MSNTFSFTVTIKPSYYAKEVEEQYDLTHRELVGILLGLTKSFTAIAELTKAFNVHYHGIIELPGHERSARKAFCDVFRGHPIFGFVNISQTANKATWIDYIRKDMKDTKDLLCRPPILWDGMLIRSADELQLDGLCQSPEEYVMIRIGKRKRVYIQ